MSFEVEFRNIVGEPAATGSAGPYNCWSTVRRTPADAEWALTAVSSCTSPSAELEELVTRVAGLAPLATGRSSCGQSRVVLVGSDSDRDAIITP